MHAEPNLRFLEVIQVVKITFVQLLIRLKNIGCILKLLLYNKKNNVSILNSLQK